MPTNVRPAEEEHNLCLGSEACLALCSNALSHTFLLRPLLATSANTHPLTSITNATHSEVPGFENLDNVFPSDIQVVYPGAHSISSVPLQVLGRVAWVLGGIVIAGSISSLAREKAGRWAGGRAWSSMMQYLHARATAREEQALQDRARYWIKMFDAGG